LEALLRAEAAYAEVLKTPGQVLNEDDETLQIHGSGICPGRHAEGALFSRRRSHHLRTRMPSGLPLETSSALRDALSPSFVDVIRQTTSFVVTPSITRTVLSASY
jgi:hypothetical protein